MPALPCQCRSCHAGIGASTQGSGSWIDEDRGIGTHAPGTADKDFRPTPDQFGANRFRHAAFHAHLSGIHRAWKGEAGKLRVDQRGASMACGCSSRNRRCSQRSEWFDGLIVAAGSAGYQERLSSFMTSVPCRVLRGLLPGARALAWPSTSE